MTSGAGSEAAIRGFKLAERVSGCWPVWLSPRWGLLGDGGSVHLPRDGFQLLERHILLEPIAARLEDFDEGVALCGGEQSKARAGIAGITRADQSVTLTRRGAAPSE